MNKFKAISEFLKLVKKTDEFTREILHPATGKKAIIYDRKEEGLVCFSAYVYGEPVGCFGAPDFNNFMGAVAYLLDWFIAGFEGVTPEFFVGKVVSISGAEYLVESFNRDISSEGAKIDTFVLETIHDNTPFYKPRRYHQPVNSVLQGFKMGIVKVVK